MKVFGKIILVIFIFILLAGGIFVYARYIEPSMLVVSRLKVKSSVEVTPKKLVFFTDTHFGSLYDQSNIMRIVKKINEENPDIVIFGGDFLDTYNKDIDVLDLEYLSEQLSRINAKTKLAVWGNHDYGGGASRVYAELMANGGFELMRNSNIFLESDNIFIQCIDDYLLGSPEFDASSFTDTAFNLLISHEPDIIDNLDLTNTDLILSGHSHGGQVNIPFFTKQALPTGAKKYVKGLYEFENEKSTKLFVSRGIGLTQLPYRFLSVPEINVIEIS